MINGFLVVDKPAGITSHDVVSRVRRIFGTRRVGHTGTLDPFATGVLPVAVNEGTKAIPFLDEGIKCYEALMRLGVTTDTLDMTGRVLTERDPSVFEWGQLEKVVSGFLGNIHQIPPMYSAIKQGGQPLYKSARQGLEVERAPRPVEIYSIELQAYNNPLVKFRVRCSRGTYVRTLADDIGRELGCGAALQELRRIASGSFCIDKSIKLEVLEDAVRNGYYEELCTPMLDALSHLVEIPLTSAGIVKVLHGRSPAWTETLLPVPLFPAESQLIRLTAAGELIAVAELALNSRSEGSIVLKRVFNACLDKNRTEAL